MTQTVATDHERAVLLDALRGQRSHVLGILQGLTDDELRRPVLPSGWTPLGLVQHLAVDVERFWFWQVVAGNVEEDDGADSADGADGAWLVAPERSGDEILDRYRREAERADAVIAETGLGEEPRWWPVDLFGTWRLRDVREVMVHVITESAVHAGHLDAARELVDGRQWLVLTS